MLPGESVVQDPAHGSGKAAGGVPTHVWTACTNAGCRAYQVQRQIWLKQVAVGVVAVPGALLCAACARPLPFIVSPPLQEDLMPKLHADRPPTSKADIPPAATETAVVDETLADGGSGENPPVAGEDGPTPLAVPTPTKKTAPRRGRANAKHGEASGA